MLGVMREYLAECQRQRVTPYEGFINHLSTSTIDCDLDRVPVNAIRIFGLALVNSGRAQRSVRNDSLRGARARDRTSNARPLHTARKEGRASKKHEAEQPSPGTSPLDQGGRLVCLRLRCGMTTVAGPAPQTRLSVLQERDRPGYGRSFRPPGTNPAATSRGLHTAATASCSRRAGSQTERCAILSQANRNALRVLLHGLCCVVEGSRDCLGVFQLSGFPLAELADVSGRLLRSLSRCHALHTVSLRGSSLSPELLSAFTTFSLAESTPSVAAAALPTTPLEPISFPALKEMDLGGCGLTDQCTRVLQFLISLSKERTGLARWQQSLRTAEGPRQPSQGLRVQGQGSPFVLPGVNRGLERLDLSENALGDSALAAVARTVRDDSTLRTLNMSQNRITFRGLLGFLASGALECSGLDVVDLSRNPCCYPEQGSLTDVPGGGIAGGAAAGGAVNSLTPASLPTLRYHQCIAGGLGQLLVLRDRTEDRPAAKQARRNPGQVSVQTHADAEAGAAEQMVSVEPSQPRQQGGPPKPHSTFSAIPFPTLTAPDPSRPIPTLPSEEASSSSAQPREPERGQPFLIPSGAPAVSSHTQEFVPAPQQEQPPFPGPPTSGSLPQQYYPLPPSSYILPVYHPYPAPSVAMCGGHPSCCPCCVRCCHALHQTHSDTAQQEAAGHRHDHSHVRPLHHPHGYPGAMNDTSLNVLSALTSPEDRSTTAMTTGRRRGNKGSLDESLEGASFSLGRDRSGRGKAHERAPSRAPQALSTRTASSASAPPKALRHQSQRRRLAVEVPSSVASEAGEVEEDEGEPTNEGQQATATTTSAHRERLDGVLAGSDREDRFSGREGAPSSASSGQRQQLRLSPLLSTSAATAGTGNATGVVLAPPDAHPAGTLVAAADIDAIAAAVARGVVGDMQVHLQRQESLVERMVGEFDNYELELTEKLEKHHQQSTTRMDILRKELLARLEKVAGEQRAVTEAAAAEARVAHEAADADRQERARREKARESQDSEDVMETKLVELMQFLMKQIQARVERAEDSHDTTNAADMQRTRVGNLASATLGKGNDADETLARQELISAANHQLRNLGW